MTANTPESIIIIGAGIVGSSLASALSAHRHVTLIDRDISGLPGSTGHAPGFVGQLNTLPTLTKLAKRSVDHYKSIEGGFRRVGGLEIGRSEAGVKNLHERKALAEEYGLPAELLNASDVMQKVPHLVGSSAEIITALYFSSDGTADAKLISRHEQRLASENGATLLNGDVTRIDTSAKGTTIVHFKTPDGHTETLETNTLILCTGIWASQLSSSLINKVIPVSHPYAYTAQRTQRDNFHTSPFVRWPEDHVYARDHGMRDGLGSYDHPPYEVGMDELGNDAYGKWEESFDAVLDRALQLVPDSTRQEFNTEREKVRQSQDSSTSHSVFNGIFSVTPDGMPLAGRLASHSGVWCAVAVWVTHAAGVAQLLARAVLGELQGEDEELLAALDPARFDARQSHALKRDALATYNDIYNKDRGSQD